MSIQTGNTVLNLKMSMKDLVAHLAQIERSVSNWHTKKLFHYETPCRKIQPYYKVSLGVSDAVFKLLFMKRFSFLHGKNKQKPLYVFWKINDVATTGSNILCRTLWSFTTSQAVILILSVIVVSKLEENHFCYWNKFETFRQALKTQIGYEFAAYAEQPNNTLCIFDNLCTI